MIRFLKGKYTNEDLELLQFVLNNALIECVNSEYSSDCSNRSKRRVSADLASVISYIDTIKEK